MKNFRSPLGVRLAALALALLVSPLAAGAQDVAPTSGGGDPAAMIVTAYGLLTTSFYRPIEGSVIHAGADAAILAYASKQGAKHPAIPATTETGAAAIVADVAALSAKYHLDRAETTYVALHGMATSTRDRWTMFFTPKEFASFDAPLDPKAIFGIGVLIDVDPISKFARAFYVVPNSPADAAGMVSGDLITAVGNTSTHGLIQPQVTHLLRGKIDTVVRVKTKPPDGKERTLALTRASVKPPTIFVKMLPEKVGYMFVTVFAEPTAEEFAASLQRLQKQGARSIIVDLRDDGGGYVFAAVSIASHFFGSGPVVTTLPREGNAVTAMSDDEDPQVTVPVAVLVNGYTASASEILAGALQDNHAATLFGTRTFGKGVEQTVTRLPGGAAIKITTARYLTPANHDVNGKGIQPDVVVMLKPHSLLGDPARDAQLQSALNYLHRQVALQEPSESAK
jgi:carboxyl-terminal processing protease